MSNANAVVDTIFGGICERFPNLSFVSVESGVGWVPFLLEAMDWQWENCGLRVEHPDNLLPSEYFRRQFYACFWFERGTLPAAIKSVGEDNILYETDFPHPTSQSPGPASAGVPAKVYIDQVMADLPETTIRKILHGNAAKLYDLDS
jgi:predicted TIM-barrel fold metal-dependent hydrolase